MASVTRQNVAATKSWQRPLPQFLASDELVKQILARMQPLIGRKLLSGAWT